MATPKVNVLLALPADRHVTLTAMAKDQEISLTALINKILREYLAQ